jgi:hypothetical protein
VSENGDATKVNLGKGRPTPKRRDAQGRRGGPVAPPPTTKREAAKRLRERQARDRAAGKAGASRAGEGERLLERDKGPVRAMVRDIIDSRRNLVLMVLPVLFVYIIANFSNNDAFVSFVLPIYLGALMAIVFDLFAIRKIVTTRVAAEFPEDTQKGHVRYAVMRGISFRRMRVPAARVKPGPLFRSRRRSS